MRREEQRQLATRFLAGFYATGTQCQRDGQRAGILQSNNNNKLNNNNNNSGDGRASMMGGHFWVRS